MKIGRLPIWQIYLAAGAICCGLRLWSEPFRESGVFMGIVCMTAVVAILAGTSYYKPQTRAPWLLFALGLFFFACGDLYTYMVPAITHSEAVFPSWGDLLYVLVYPALMAGLILLVRQRNPGTDRSGIVDSIIITLGFSLLAWVYLIAPYLHADDALLAKIVSVSYPLGDVILLAAIVRLAVGGGSRQPAFYLLSGSVIVLLATDSIYGLLTLHGEFDFQSWLDVGWMAFYVMWGSVALHPSMKTLEYPSTEFVPRLTRSRLGALMAASLIAPSLLLGEQIGHADMDMTVVVSTSVVLVALIVIRMSGLVREQERATNRERVLASAGAELVGAAGRGEIHHAGVSAARAFAGEDATILLCRVENNRAEILAANNAAAETPDGWQLGAGTTRSLVARSVARNSAGPLDPTMRIDLRAQDEHDEVFVLGLDVRGGDSGVLVITTREPITKDIQSALQSLVQQMSLALESATLSEAIHRRQSEARFATLVKHSSDLITVLDSDAKVVYQSPSIESVLGYTPEELLGTRFDRLLPAPEKQRLASLIADDAAGGTGETQGIECALEHADGTRRQFEILHTNLVADPDVQGIVLNSRDISERKLFEEQLAHQAFHDPVTNLANRALFSERVRHAVARTRRGSLSLGVIFVDLDDFKTVNDSLGHAAGDQVLVEVAKRLSSAIRASDTAARFGGDEFAILLEDLESPQEAADAADRVLEVLTESLTVAEKELFISASLGIAVMEAGSAADSQELIRDADVAMYMAKREGKGTYRLFEPEMHAGVLDRLELRADLQRAINGDQFELDYQPIMRLHDGAVSGVEALVRWRHPERGLLGPDWFIPLAEETGMIVELGQWVLNEASRKAVAMQAAHQGDNNLTISVNLSLKQLQHEDCVEHVQSALAQSGLDPSTLILEITETLMMTDPDLAVQRLADLRALGVGLSMDDFGSGYSSLSYLSKFPVDELKMDRSFLTEGATPKASGLTAAILALGLSLDLTVVAEGIEHREQWMKLRELGCELGQGFYFARPMSAESMMEFLRSHKDGLEQAFGLDPVADAT